MGLKRMDQNLRPAAVAGRFYPADAGELRARVERLLGEAEVRPGQAPKGLIVPHAGYDYSGPIAASGYAQLKALDGTVRKVILIGPAHFVAVPGLALPAAAEFATPVGRVPIHAEARRIAEAFGFVTTSAAAHKPEHALEVQLPFLQMILGEFELVPLLAGRVEPAQIAAVLEALWGGPETLVVISSDLSHFLTWSAARELDSATAAAIERLSPEEIGENQACGRVPIQGLLHCARTRGLAARTLDLRNSGDTAGSRERVVGYGAFAFSAAPPGLQN